MRNTTSCACHSADIFEFKTPKDILAGFEHVKKSLIGRCDHVGIEEFRKEDYGVAAVFFARCSDTALSRPACGPATEKLLLFGLRTGWKNRRILTSAIEVIATPGRSLSLEGESPDSPTGTSLRTFAEPDVVYPRSNQIPDKDSTWHYAIPVNIQQSDELVNAVINVIVKVVHGADTREEAITLPVKVPKGVPVDLLYESMDVLLRSNTQESKRLMFRIGDQLLPLSASGTLLAQLHEALSPRFFADHTPVLNALNKNLSHLVHRKADLIEAKDGANLNDKFEIKAKLRSVEEEIGATEKEILTILDSANRVSIFVAHFRELDEDAISEVVAESEKEKHDLQAWAGDYRANLAILFTDIVGYTKLGQALGDKTTSDVRNAHFHQSRDLIRRHGGREVKTIGDSFMVVFRSVGPALDYAVAISTNTGHLDVRIRAAIHVGSLEVEKKDVFGTEVNFTARVLSAISGPEIWLSDRAMKDLKITGAHQSLQWQEHAGIKLKSFESEPATLWSLEAPEES